MLEGEGNREVFGSNKVELIYAIKARMNIKKKVRLVLQQTNKQIPIPKQKEALNKIKDALLKSDRDYLVLIEDNDSKDTQKPDYQVAINENGEYQILNQSGLPIQNIHRPIKLDETAAYDAAKNVVKKLVHLVNYNNIWELDNPHSTSSLSSNKLVVELFRLENYDPTERPTPNQLLPLATKGNVKIVKKDKT